MIAPCASLSFPGTLRVLVAEDEPAILRVYNALFRTVGGVDSASPASPRRGHVPPPPLEFTLCTQGDEAFEAVRKALDEGRPYGLIFLDVRMPPGADGLVTAERIRALDDRAHIVMVTGYSDYSVDEIAERVPPRDRLLYLQKPFHIQEIRQITSAFGTRWLDEYTTSAEPAPSAGNFAQHVPIPVAIERQPLTLDRIDEAVLAVQSSAAMMSRNACSLARDIAPRLTDLLGLTELKIWGLSDDGARLLPLSRVGSDGEELPLPSPLPLTAKREYMAALGGVRSLEEPLASLPSKSSFPGKIHYNPATRAVLHVPIRALGEIVGVMWCEAADEEHHWPCEDRSLAVAFSDCLAQVMEDGCPEVVEDRVLSTKERYLDLFENAVDMLFVHLITGEFISVSPGCTRITGYSIEEATGQRVQDHIAPEQRAHVIDITARKIKGLPAPEVFEVDLLTKNGERVPVEVNSWPVYKDGRAIAIQGIARDISERRRAEEVRRTLEKQLLQSQRLEAIGRLAGGVAHDFNNLLTAILGSGEMLLLGMDQDDTGRRRVEEILTAGQRAAALTRQLLAFSRRQIMQPRRLNLNSVVTDMDSLLRRIIGEDIELRTRLEPNVAPIKADPGQLEQVVINLAVNGRDAMPSGGKLTIATADVNLDGSAPPGDFVIRPGRYVRLTVEDNGVGMAPDIQSHIFEPFFSTKAQDGKGTGLGLATVYGIVKQSGGYIWFDTEPGAGTAFHLFFPVAEEGPLPDVATVQTSTLLDVPGGSETVLLVEDDCALRSLVSRILRGHGYAVLEAKDGVDAIRVSRDHNGTIDLLLTDVVMPYMGGRELSIQLYQERQGLKILLMSGYSDQDTVHESMKETGASFLQKPFTPTTLVKKLRRILDSKK